MQLFEDMSPFLLKVKLTHQRTKVHLVSVFCWAEPWLEALTAAAYQSELPVKNRKQEVHWTILSMTSKNALRIVVYFLKETSHRLSCLCLCLCHFQPSNPYLSHSTIYKRAFSLFWGPVQDDSFPIFGFIIYPHMVRTVQWVKQSCMWEDKSLIFYSHFKWLE